MPPLLFLPLVLVFFAAADASLTACRNATCGAMAVAYPFWLINSNSPASALDCGYPGLGLRCVNNTLILPFRTHKYRVLAIEYSTHTISITDADMEYSSTNSSCPHFHANLTIDDSSWLELASSDSNITFLYNCKSDASWASAWKLAGCAAGSENSSYVLLDGGVTGEAYGYECETVVMAPVLDAHKKTMAGVFGRLPPENRSFGEVLSAGFQLTYSAHSDKCSKCERTKGWCGYRHNETSTTMDFTCFCEEGPTKSHCGTRASSLVNLIASLFGVLLALDFRIGVGGIELQIKTNKKKMLNKPNTKESSRSVDSLFAGSNRWQEMFSVVPVE
uniref:Wall-associated receptor kinase galacturonan-binding domain-containing protein n=1 Tax=Oryza brachyantha TaxID=4533 RepID=J3L326_ORYBR